MTPAECLLWKVVRDRSICKLKFRRQHPFGPYILDFYCHERKIAVEIDGDSHGFEEQIAYDTIRTKYLNKQDIRVIRFTNIDIQNNMVGVIDEILTVSKEPSP